MNTSCPQCGRPFPGKALVCPGCRGGFLKVDTGDGSVYSRRPQYITKIETPIPQTPTPFSPTLDRRLPAWSPQPVTRVVPAVSRDHCLKCHKHREGSTYFFSVRLRQGDPSRTV